MEVLTSKNTLLLTEQATGKWGAGEGGEESDMAGVVKVGMNCIGLIAHFSLIFLPLIIIYLLIFRGD